MKNVRAFFSDRIRLYSFLGGVALILLAVAPAMLPQTELRAARYDELVELRDRTCAQATGEGVNRSFALGTRLENGHRMEYLGCDVVGTHVVTWWKKRSP